MTQIVLCFEVGKGRGEWDNQACHWVRKRVLREPCWLKVWFTRLFVLSTERVLLKGMRNSKDEEGAGCWASWWEYGVWLIVAVRGVEECMMAERICCECWEYDWLSVVFLMGARVILCLWVRLLFLVSFLLLSGATKAVLRVWCISESRSAGMSAKSRCWVYHGWDWDCCDCECWEDYQFYYYHLGLATCILTFQPLFWISNSHNFFEPKMMEIWKACEKCFHFQKMITLSSTESVARFV